MCWSHTPDRVVSSGESKASECRPVLSRGFPCPRGHGVAAAGPSPHACRQGPRGRRRAQGPRGVALTLPELPPGVAFRSRGPRLPEGSPFSAPRHHLCALSRAAPRRSCWGQLGTRPKARQRLATAGAPGRGPAPRPVSGRCSGGWGGSPRPLLPGSPGRELCACKVGTVRTFGCSGATKVWGEASAGPQRVTLGAGA